MIEIERLCLVTRPIIPSRLTVTFALYARSYILIIDYGLASIEGNLKAVVQVREVID